MSNSAFGRHRRWLDQQEEREKEQVFLLFFLFFLVLISTCFCWAELNTKIVFGVQLDYWCREKIDLPDAEMKIVAQMLNFGMT